MSAIEFEIRRITSAAPDRDLALHQALGVRAPDKGRGPAPEVADLLAQAQRRAVSIGLMIGAYLGDERLACCLAVEWPGSAALVFVSKALPSVRGHRATVAVLRAAASEAWQRPIALLETLLPPADSDLPRALAEADFRFLTPLHYLRRPTSLPQRREVAIDDLEWLEYASDLEPLFRDAVERTYVQSLDCPELTGLRSTAQVLEGHRVAGVFDPGLWWVTCRNREPVGVMLLNRLERGSALEIVYMGVSQPSRGTGVADALLARAVDAAADAGVTYLALAVDERNTPARRMYARWGFQETAVRDAWIASPPRP